ncbi:hypothetical protein HOE22_01220 [Candidatus Woesearchaeota archaeon]|jgi:hypothetical protein|nr:hypothetical protein [Candidatus Woesearchaeota archaeon]
MKKVLFVATVYRQGERIHPIIPELSVYVELDCLCIHQMGRGQEWNGNMDMRELFHRRYDAYFNSVSWDFKGVLNNISKYDAIIFDDSRDKGTEIPTKIMYPIAKEHGITVYGNQHGNNKFSDKSYEVDHYKKVFDYCFLLGQYNKNIFSKYVDESAFLLGGIPSNDALKYYERTNEHILVITNFLGNERRMFPTFFSDEMVQKTKLADLQQTYGKRVVVKIKSRDRHFALGNPYENDISFVKTVLKNNSIEGDVLRDVDDDNLLISQAHSVIASPSTMCFKPIQMGIPTVILDRSGYIGAYENFYGFTSCEGTGRKIYGQLERGRDIEYIEDNIAGGVDYNSTEIYIDNLINTIGK